MANKADIKRLEKKVTDLSNALARLGKGEDLKQLLIILRRPGWTTLAELIFASAILDSLQANVKALDSLKSKLLKGSAAVIDE